MPTPSAMTTLNDASKQLLDGLDNWQAKKAQIRPLIEQYKAAFTAAYAEAKPKGAAEIAAVMASEKATVSAIQTKLINFNKATTIAAPPLTTPIDKLDEVVQNAKAAIYLGERKLQEKVGVDEHFQALASSVGQIVRHVITVTDPEEYRGFKPDAPANGFVPSKGIPAASPPAGPQKDQNSR